MHTTTASNTPIAISDLPQHWRDRAAELRTFAAEPQAVVLEHVAAQLERVLNSSDNELLGLSAAAQTTGYSVAQLRRMISESKIPNAGVHGAPLIRRSDLPRKPGHGVVKLDLGMRSPVQSRRQIARAVAIGE